MKTVPEVVTAAMKKLEAQIAWYSTCTAGKLKQSGKLNKVKEKPT